MKKLIGVAAAAATLIALTGCAGGAGDAGDAGSDKLVVGFSQVGAESGWRTANMSALQT